MQCPVIIEEDSCLYNFQNGRCDHKCDAREHLFDGFDCAVTVPECTHDDHCSRRFANGVCDARCNSAACQWDGGDCIASALDLAADHVLLKVERKPTHAEYSQPSHRNTQYRLLARHLSYVTRSLLRIVAEPRTTQPEIRTSDEWRHNPEYTIADTQFSDHHQTKTFDNVVLKLDNTNCHKKCLRHVHNIAKYLQLTDLSSPALELSIHAITSELSARYMYVHVDTCTCIRTVFCRYHALFCCFLCVVYLVG